MYHSLCESDLGQCTHLLIDSDSENYLSCDVLQQYSGTNFLQEAGKARSNKPEHLSRLEEKVQPKQDPVVDNILEQCDQSCHRVGRLAEKEQQGLGRNNYLCLGH
jgi:hypothetical protein